jgi:hypothetical protein
MTRTYSRVPQDNSRPEADTQFLDSIDRRQLALGQITLLSDSATLADVIEKINAIITTHQTR